MKDRKDIIDPEDFFDGERDTGKEEDIIYLEDMGDFDSDSEDEEVEED